MMSDRSRALLDAAREGLAPDAAVAARVRAKVAATVGASAAVTGSAAAIKAGTSSLLLKLGAVLFALGTVTTVLIVASPDRSLEVPRVAVTPADSDDLRDDIRRLVGGLDLLGDLLVELEHAPRLSRGPWRNLAQQSISSATTVTVAGLLGAEWFPERSTATTVHVLVPSPA